MEERELKREDIPMGYPLCFNDECPNKGKCMHYQARLLKAEGRNYGNAVFPTAWQDGKYTCFREKRFVKKAWGFTSLYNNVPKNQNADARSFVRSYFSSGMGPYYRYHHGENKLSPKQQADILKIIADYGSIEGIKFDNYVEDWDFDY